MRRRDSRGPVDLPQPPSPYLPTFGGNLALDFANSIDRYRQTPDADALFPGYGNLLGWLFHAGFVSDDDVVVLMRLAKREPKEAVAVRRRAVALREAIFQSITQKSSDHLPVINDEWRHAIAHRQPRFLAETPIATWVWDSIVALDQPLRVIALEAMQLISSEQVLRVRQCESPGCAYLFLDTTRNGSRRFCRADVCGNRSRVQRFREGQKGSDD